MSVNTKVNGQLVPSAGLYSVTKPIGMADIYSTEEKEVGLWVNNKPLYQKSFYVDSLPSSAGTKSIATGLTGIEMCKLGECWSNGFGEINIVRCESANAITYGVGCWVAVTNGVPTITIEVGRDRSSIDAWITIQYTKIADTPWGGKFVPQGYGYVSSGDIYSFEERQIGVWADGKPLYQKTVSCGTLPNNATKTVAHGISNIDVIVNAYGHAKATANQTPIPFVNNTSVGSQIALFSDATNITLRTSEDKSPYTGYVTLQYTKTTDVAGSGIWTPSGDLAVHYSTNEQVIGTWIDGKTLYQKTVDCGALPANTTKNVAHGITDIDRIVSVTGCAFRSASGSETGIPIPSTHYQTIGNQNEVSVNFTNIVLRNGNSSASAFDETQVTIQYTKTS